MPPALLWLLILIGGLLIIIFLPFDWWQKAPSRQRDRLIGRILGNYVDISPRNIVLRTLFLCIYVVGLMFAVLFLPIIGLYLVSALLLSYFVRKISRQPSADLPGLPGILGISCLLLFFFAFSAGLLAPLRVFQVVIYFILGRPAGGFLETFAVGKDWFSIDLGIGFLGIFVITLWLLIDAFWRLRQARQVENLPPSRVRSLVPGMVELQGIVRPASGNADLKGDDAIRITWNMHDYLNPAQGISRFALDDGTGRVLVDARECRVRAGWIADIYSIFGMREIVLAKRVRRDDRDDSVTRTLEYGDAVFVIGNAEMDPEADPNARDSERLVIRPSGKTHWNAMLLRTLFGIIKPPSGRDIHNVFFLSDTDEADARRHILKGFRTVMLFGCFWLFASAGLIWSTYLPGRMAPPLDSWRNAYWDKTNWDDRRLSRFEKFIQSPAAGSSEAVPALIEALQYEDYRYQEKAAFALKRLLPGVREEAKEAVPLLTDMLRNTNTRFVQTPLIVLRGFGPLAKDAVPALIGLLAVSDEIVRFQAVRTLGAIGPGAREALPRLRALLEDSSPGGSQGGRLPDDAFIGEGIPVRGRIHQEVREALRRIEG